MVGGGGGGSRGVKSFTCQVELRLSWGCDNRLD